jgi:hypothetical protein
LKNALKTLPFDIDILPEKQAKNARITLGKSKTTHYTYQKDAK